MRTLLFIAYYLPPMGSSGVQRPLNLLRHLPKHGWNPIVLAPETGYYHTLDFSLGEELDELGLTIYRVKSDTPFHSIGGSAKKAPAIPEGISKVLRWASALRYIPDNKIGWIGSAFEQAKHIVDEHQPELIFSTSPPPSCSESAIIDPSGILWNPSGMSSSPFPFVNLTIDSSSSHIQLFIP
jgi:hypothetical protein